MSPMNTPMKSAPKIPVNKKTQGGAKLFPRPKFPKNKPPLHSSSQVEPMSVSSMAFVCVASVVFLFVFLSILLESNAMWANDLTACRLGKTVWECVAPIFDLIASVLNILAQTFRWDKKFVSEDLFPSVRKINMYFECKRFFLI